MFKEKLAEVYQKHKSGFESVFTRFPEIDISGPHMCSPSKVYEDATFKIVIIGQETAGWGVSIEPSEQQSVYEQFNLGENYYASPFWNIIRKIERMMGQPEYSVAWLNINKFDVDGGRPFGEYLEEIQKLDSILLEEIEILKPDMALFFTGPTFDNRILNLYSGAILQEIPSWHRNALVRVSHENLPKLSFRSYHPGYLRRSGLEEKYINYLDTVRREMA
jgi:hypothetical protein